MGNSWQDQGRSRKAIGWLVHRTQNRRTSRIKTGSGALHVSFSNFINRQPGVAVEHTFHLGLYHRLCGCVSEQAKGLLVLQCEGP